MMVNDWTSDKQTTYILYRLLYYIETMPERFSDG